MLGEEGRLNCIKAKKGFGKRCTERESEEVRCRHGVGGRAGENRRKASIAGMCLVQRGEAVLHPPCLGERAKWGQEIRTF